MMNIVVLIIIVAVLGALPVRCHLAGNFSKGVYVDVSVQYLFFKFQRKIDLEPQALLERLLAQIIDPSAQERVVPTEAENLPAEAMTLKSLYQQYWPRLKKHLRKVHLEWLEIDVQAGLSNQYVTGVLSGVVWSVLGACGLAWRAEQVQLKFTPDFTDAGVMAYVHGIISISLGHIIRSGIVALGIILRIFCVKIWVNLKRREAYGESSY